MTATASARPVRVIDLEDTVTINRNPIGQQTQRLFPIARDTEARVTDTNRESFAVLSPSGEQPLVGIAPDQAAVLDALDRRFARFPGADVDVRPGRHRAPQPSLLARWFGRGRRDGA